MSGTFETQGGETFGSIARQTTGNDLDTALIRRANPSLREPLPAGAIIQIPMAQPSQTSIGQGELDITVNGQRIGAFTDFELALSVDAIRKCSFSVPNEIETRALFMPLGSQRITVDHLGQRLFTGRCESPQPDNSPESKRLQISCYSECGVLENCTPSIESFPREWKETLLENIASDLCLEHGISVLFETPTTARFKRVNIEPGQGVLGFLADLASQRGVIVSDNEFGQLKIHKSLPMGPIVSFLEPGKHPTENVSLTIDESKYYSSVTGIVPAKSRRGKIGAKFTVRNPFATDVIRSYTFDANDIEPGELPIVVQSTAGRMFAELISCNVEVATWHNDLGAVYQPGQLVSLKSEIDFCPTPFQFMVAMVTLQKSAGSTIAGLNLVLPGVYSGTVPTRLPWL